VARSRPAPTRNPEIVVPKGQHAIVVRARNHDWIALTQDGNELVRDHGGSAETTFAVPPGTYSVLSDGRIERVDVIATKALESPVAALSGDPPLLLRLSSNAGDQHAIDGVGEILADGESSCTITIEKIDATGDPMRRRRDTDEVFLRSTGGTIKHTKKDERVRSIKLQAGRASFRLVSEPTPRLVTISAFGASSPSPSELQIEFV
jgi:hypothetical protein